MELKQKVIEKKKRQALHDKTATELPRSRSLYQWVIGFNETYIAPGAQKTNKQEEGTVPDIEASTSSEFCLQTIFLTQRQSHAYMHMNRPAF